MAELTSVGKQIQLDFARSLNPVVVYAKHGDVNSRTITVEPLKNGETYTLSNGITAKFACKKPDGKYIYNDYPTVVPSTNLITVPLTEQTLAAAGEAICSVILYDEENQKVLSTQNFILQIEPSPMTFAELESTDEIQTIYGLIDDTEELLATIQAKLENGDFIGPQGPQGEAGETPDLSEYAKTSEVDEALSGKVDKVDGKGLSTNDFTDSYKNKLDNIPPGGISGNAMEYLAAYDNTGSEVAALSASETDNFINIHAGEGITITEAADYYPGIKINVEGLSNKVDKVDGKGLSTNDYTDSDKIKVNDAPGWVAPPKAGNVPVTVSAPAGYLVDSGFSLGASVPADAVFTDTHYKVALAMGNLVNAIHSGVSTDA